MDVCYNPVLDEEGNITFIVERLRDITEKKILDKILQDSKEKYKQILNNFQDAIVIIVDNKINPKYIPNIVEKDGNFLLLLWFQL